MVKRNNGRCTNENTVAVFNRLNIDVAPLTREESQVNVKFMLGGGKHGLKVNKVILLLDRKEISTTQHEGVLGAGQKLIISTGLVLKIILVHQVNIL